MITLSNLISNTWTLYSQNLRTYLKLSLLIFLITVPIGAIGLLLNTLKYAGIAGMAVSIVVGFCVLILTILLTIVLVRVADKQLSRFSAPAIVSSSASSVSIKNEFKAALSLWFEVLLIAVIVSLIQIAGLILLIVPGIIFSVWFAFAIYFAILDFHLQGGRFRFGGGNGGSGGNGIKNSLIQSKVLVKGRFWPVLLRIFVPTILWSMFNWAVSQIFINLVELTQEYLVVSADKIVTYFADFAKLFGSIYINALFVPLFIISMVILFRDLQASKAD